MANDEQQSNATTGSVKMITNNAPQMEHKVNGEEDTVSKTGIKNGSGKEEPAEHSDHPKEPSVRQKRKKVCEKRTPGVDTIDSKPSLDHRSVGKESVEATHPAPSSEALGNLSKANGKRLKLDLKSNQEHHEPTSPVGLLHEEKVIVRSKPPIPPKPDVRTMQGTCQGTSQPKVTGSPATPHTKGKKQQVTEAHNAHTVQKLLAQNEQMRLELSELRSSLAAERNAVRVLRAQNESDLRKTKSECKKLQEALQHQKRHTHAQTQCPSVSLGGGTPTKRAHRGSAEQDQPQGGGWTSETRGPHQQQQCCLEVLKLNQEISALRETNKFLEEKYQ
uniref:JAKMIP_CC3 domain-containing protein n=1 Tax=Anopheles maculatus TaxID=74869 RepID=A0A182SW26_9DIPT